MRRLRSNDACWCASGKKYKRCHGDARQLRRDPVRLGTVGALRVVPAHIARPDYVTLGRVTTPVGPQIQTPESLVRLRRACQAAASVLLRTGEALRPGVTTDELDAVAHATYIELGAYPSTLQYKGFRKSICTSVNGVICHGVPDSRALEDGDIVNIDVTAYLDAMHGDTSATFLVGQGNEPTRALIETTRQATLRGVAAVGPDVALRAVAEAIEPFAASRGFGVVQEYGGHGIGETFHAAPHVDHCVLRHNDTMLRAGMTFTIEPMLTAGEPTFLQADDGWTEHVLDNMVSAQFEHTVLVTGDGCEILTVTDDGRTAVGTLDDLGVLDARG